MQWRRSDPQALLTLRNRRIVYRLDINSVIFQQYIADVAALDRIFDHDRHDVPLIGKVRNAVRIKPVSHFFDLPTVPHPLEIACLEMPNRGACSCHDCRRQRGGEYEAACERPDEIAEHRGTCDVAPDNSVRLAKRAFDQSDPIRDAFPIRDAPSPRSVHSNRVNLVQISHCAVLLGDIANLGDRSDASTHGINRLERYDLRRIGRALRQLFRQILYIIVLPNLFFRLRVPDSFNHGSVVHLIRKDDGIRQARAER